MSAMIRWMTSGLTCFAVLFSGAGDPHAHAAGGSFELIIKDEKTSQPVPAQLKVWRADQPNPLTRLSRAISDGQGFVIDRRLSLELPEGDYRYQITRGPEYRVLTGNFSLSHSSSDRKLLYLRRIDDLRERGWTSGDCCVAGSIPKLRERMGAANLHVVGVVGEADDRARLDSEAAETSAQQPVWISDHLVRHDGLLFQRAVAIDTTRFPIESILGTKDDLAVKVAVENPFAWPLPVWLASGHIDGFFLLGDWARLDQQVTEVPSGRGVPESIEQDARAVGRWADLIYTQLLETGLRIAPLAGSGDAAATAPLGYNRLYVAGPLGEYRAGSPADPRQVESEAEWWESAWSGRSVVTNGPLLRPKLGGEPPGHVFRGKTGEVLRLQMEIGLAVREPLEFLEVVHNGRVHYRVPLSEFAQTNGLIPTIHADQSGWVTVRVVATYDQHLRYATSAPWWIEIGDQPRVTREAVAFFQGWQQEYEQHLRQQFEAQRLTKAELDRLAPFIRYARRFWEQKASIAVPGDNAP